jgi:hypothetical protein
MSAACAPAAIANIPAARKNLRIATLRSNTLDCADHRSLTLTNRCATPDRRCIFAVAKCARAKQNGAGKSRAVSKH